MSTFGNGFLAYHIEVRVKPGYLQTVNTAVAQWQDECRAQSGWPGFAASILKRIKDIKGVLEVSCEGPQSAVLIPLRMIHKLTGSTCKMSTTIGTGPITLTIEKDLASWGIELEPVNRLENADAPLEFSFRDSHGASSLYRRQATHCYSSAIRVWQRITHGTPARGIVGTDIVARSRKYRHHGL